MSCIDLPGNILSVNPLSKEGDISYQLLLNASQSSIESDALSTSTTYSNDVKEVTLSFYMEDGTEQKLIVEENLRILDLCQLLALKFNVARSQTWSLVEQLTALGIERTLEDHEEILTVYASWKDEKNKFVFKQDFCKYEFFRTPQQFFPLSMMNLGSAQLDCLAESPELAQLLSLQSLLILGEGSPCIQSLMWYKNVGEENWKRLLFRIEGSTLFVSSSSKGEKRQFWPLKDLHEYEIYKPIEPGCNNDSPTSYYFCLKPKDYRTKDISNLVWLCCESEKQCLCWIISMRLAKHGRKICENYKELQLRHSDSPSAPADSLLSDYTPMKPRVAMDFTGSQSRVIEDPNEAKAVAAAEGHLWKRRLPCCRSPGCQASSRSVSELGIHALQPWFYSGMSRDEATHLLTKYGTVDGVFLVRESRRNPGSFVLSYVFNRKIHHCQVVPVEENAQLCYSVDNGKTKFYDLLQLVEFYQLNIGSLPTKLTHFLVHRPHSNHSTE